MDRAASIFLRSEIRPQDCRNLIRWIENEHVTRYLNESGKAPEEIGTLLKNTPPYLLTCRFNQHGRFYLVCDEAGRSIGFSKLTPGTAGRYEIVYVIGEDRLWGRGFGKQALRKTLKIAFLEKRAEAVVAKICRENRRSVRAVLRCGMRYVGDTGKLCIYRITMKEFLETLKQA